MKKLSLILFILGFVFNAKAQVSCDVEAFASSVDILCGDTVRLSAIGEGITVFENDFDNCNVGTGWSSTQQARFDNPCGVSANGSCYLWFGDTSPAPRRAATNDIDLSTGGMIHFGMRYSRQGDASPCEGPDLPDEGVSLEYSVDGGGSWILIRYYDPLGGTDPGMTSWTNYSERIPVGAQTATTRLRWIQNASSGAGTDHWGLENVEVIVNPPDVEYVWQHTGDPQPTGATPDVVPTTTTTYTVDYTFGGCTSQASVTVNVAKQVVSVSKTPDGPLCPGVPYTLIGESSLKPPRYTCGISQTGCLGATAIADLGAGNLTAGATMMGTGASGTCFNGNGTPDRFMRAQMIYRSTEFPVEFQNGGQFSVIEFEAGAAATLPGFTIKMGCTAKNEFNSSAQAEFTDNLDIVYTSKNTAFTAGVNRFDLDAVYDYDGTSNVIIQICWSGDNGPNGSFLKFNSGFNSMVVTRSCTALGCDGYGSSNAMTQNRINTKIIGCYRPDPVLTYTWTPNINLSDNLNDTTISTPDATTTYTLTVQDINQPPGCAVSESIVVETTELGDFSPSYNGPLCVGDNLELKANIAGMATYTWTGPNGFTSNQENPAIVNSITLADAGTYSVFVDDGSGCTNTKTIEVEINAPPIAGTPSDNAVCNTDAAFDLFGFLAGNDADGTWTDDTPSGALSGSNVDPTAISTAILPGVFDYTYTVSADGCPDATATVQVTVGRQGDAGTGGTFNYCETEGIVNLFDLLTDNPETIGSWNDDNSSGQLTLDEVDLTDLGFGNYDFTYTVSTGAECPDDQSLITLVVEDQPDAGRDSLDQICTDNTYNLFDYLTPGTDANGFWLEISNSGTFDEVTGDFNTTGISQGQYNFSYILGGTSPCVNDTAYIDLNVFSPPIISNVSDACEGDNLGYRITFRITGGDSVNYSVNYPGTITSTSPFIYTSDVIPSGQTEVIEVSDPIGCGIATVTAQKSCNCVTDAGTMRVDTLINLCEGEPVSGIYNGGYVSDINDTLVFYLHSGNGTSLDNPVDSGHTPDFTYNTNIVLGQTYYISATAANNRGDDYLDYGDLCFIVAPGTPVIWHELPDATIAITPTNICPGDPAVLDINAVKGTAPFDYEIVLTPGGNDDKMGAPDNYTENITPIDTTTYTITKITDAFGCVSITSHSATINVNQAPIAQITTPSGCSDPSATFAVSLTGAGSSFDFTYSNNFDNTTQNINGATGPTMDIPATVMDSNAVVKYFLQSVSDNSGSVCPGVVLDTFYLSPTPSLKLLASDGVYCQGQPIPLNYYLTGIGPWNIDAVDDQGGAYNFNVSSRQGVVNITDVLNPGTYVINFTTITDLGTGANCTSTGTGTANVTVNPGPLAQVDIENPADGSLVNALEVCEYATGVDLHFTKTRGNGTVNVTYTQNGSSPITIAVGNTVEVVTLPNDLAPGVYNFNISSVTDNSAASCSGVGNTVTLTVNPTPTVNGFIAPSESEICDGDAFVFQYDVYGNGNITFDLVNQNAETSSLSGTEVSNTHTANITPANLGLNNYTIVNIQDASNPVCTGTSPNTFTVDVKPIPTAALAVNGPQSICFGDDFVFDIATTGSGNIQVDYTDNSGSFNGSITQPAGTYTQSISGLPVGSYVFSISNISASSAQTTCTNTSTSTITVTVNALPNASPAYVPGDATCFGDDVTLEFNINPAAYPLDIYYRDSQGNISTDNFIDANNNNTLVIADANKTLFVDSIVDANGCIGYPNTQNPLTVHALPTASLFGNESVCAGDASFINVDLTGTAPFDVRYQDQDSNFYDVTINITGTSVLPHTVADSTTYTLVYVNDGNTPQCSNTNGSTADINIKARPVINISAPVNDGCAPFDVQVFNNSTAPSPYSFSTCLWTLSNGTTSSDCSEFTTQLTDVNRYDLNLTITNDEGCTSSRDFNDYLSVNPDPVADFNYSPDEPNIASSLIQFYNKSSGASSFNWVFNSTDTVYDISPAYQAPTEAGSIVDVCLEAFSSFGCRNEVCEPIVIRDLLLVFIPNTFTPDGDNINEIFVPIVNGLLEVDYQMDIYDRWGRVIFSSQSQFEGWDGTYRGEPAQSTTYTVRVKGISRIDGSSEVIEYGFVNLIR
jgi:gliding motility-associated-like protein